MTKRLFQVRHPDGNVLPHGYDNKVSAKLMRDHFNETYPGHTVAYGPDHYMFEVQQFVRKHNI